MSSLVQQRCCQAFIRLSLAPVLTTTLLYKERRCEASRVFRRRALALARGAVLRAFRVEGVLPAVHARVARIFVFSWRSQRAKLQLLGEGRVRAAVQVQARGRPLREHAAVITLRGAVHDAATAIQVKRHGEKMKTRACLFVIFLSCHRSRNSRK